MVVQLVVVNRGFQSTRLREARLRKAEHSFLDCCFNPRAYVRRDFTHITTVINYISFNPRAYVRRDPLTVSFIPKYICFNPRAYVRRDCSGVLQYVPDWRFQSTRLREARLSKYFNSLPANMFQSTRLREARLWKIF